MPAKKEPSLLPESENAASISARLLRWLTTIGRFIVVFTELIVVLAFMSRFYFDRKNSDISETVRQQKAILESTKEFEHDYLVLQKQIAFIKKFNTQSDNQLSSKIMSLTQSVPPSITFTNLSIPNPEKTTVTTTVSLTAQSETDIVNFITNLILNPDIASVDIQSIEKKKNETNYAISLTILFKPPANARS